LHGIAPAEAANATCDGCTGADSSAGPSASRAAISGGKYAHSRLAADVSRDRTISVLMYRLSARFGAA